MTRSTAAALISLLSLTVLVIGAIAAQGPDARNDPEAQRKVLQVEMGKKLKHAQSLLTGLTIEDFPTIVDNAESLKRVGADTLAKVTPSLEYVKYTTEFVSLADELSRRAKDHDLNGATLSYVRLTINCVECHKHVRDFRALDLKK